MKLHNNNLFTFPFHLKISFCIQQHHPFHDHPHKFLFYIYHKQDLVSLTNLLQFFHYKIQKES